MEIVKSSRSSGTESRGKVECETWDLVRSLFKKQLDSFPLGQETGGLIPWKVSNRMSVNREIGHIQVWDFPTGKGMMNDVFHYWIWGAQASPQLLPRIPGHVSIQAGRALSEPVIKNEWMNEWKHANLRGSLGKWPVYYSELYHHSTIQAQRLHVTFSSHYCILVRQPGITRYLRKTSASERHTKINRQEYHLCPDVCVWVPGTR